jgi:putative ABC transport system permease protein
LFGTLRCLGVTRREVFALVLSEAFLMAFGWIGRDWTGAVVGPGDGAHGHADGQRSVLHHDGAIGGDCARKPVERPAAGLLATISPRHCPPGRLPVPPRAALLRSGLESKARGQVGWAALAGILSGGLGLGLFAMPSTSLLIGFSGTLAVVVGFALLSSVSLVGLMRALVPLTGRLFGLIGRMAPRNLVNALSRTAVAVAALMVAVAVIIGVSLMIDSFRYTVIVWLEQTLQGDVYISVPSFNATRSSVGH